MKLENCLPMHRNLICNPPPSEARTNTGIIVPVTEVNWVELEVVRVSPDAERVEAGDKILIHKMNLTEFTFDGKKYVLCSEVDVVLHETTAQ